jgi:hypothetical protein
MQEIKSRTWPRFQSSKPSMLLSSRKAGFGGGGDGGSGMAGGEGAGDDLRRCFLPDSLPFLACTKVYKKLQNIAVRILLSFFKKLRKCKQHISNLR